MQISNPVIKSFLFCVILVFSVCFLNYLLVPYSSMMRRFRAFHEEEKKGNIDVLVIGSSLEFNSIDPDIMSEKLGQHCAVFGPQGANSEVAYYCLVDALGKNKLKTVVIGWDLLENFESPHKQYPSNRCAQLYREMISHSKNNPMLLELGCKNILKQRYTMSFFEYAAFPENALQIKDVISSRKEKLLPFTSETFFEKSMDISTISDVELAYTFDSPYFASVSVNEIFYIKKIQKLCEEKSIKLYFISCPYPYIVQQYVKDFLVLTDCARNIFENLSISYIDMYDENLFPNIADNSNYHDITGHLIVPAKKHYTELVCQYIRIKDSK